LSFSKEAKAASVSIFALASNDSILKKMMLKICVRAALAAVLFAKFLVIK
jgi:hypothetical protein